MNFIGLDIGGANIKLASTNGEANQIPFPFWSDRNRLREVLLELKGRVESTDLMGVTMTAELADCFDTKSEGVEFIVDVVGSVFEPNDPLFYQTDGTMRDASTAKKDWRLTAASNWHALAWLAFHQSDQRSGIVIDIGSTSTDIIPVVDGMPLVSCQDDMQRLSNGQLFYAGVGRTPVCSLLNQVELDAGSANLAREFFASTKDVLIWLGELSENLDCNDTADGRSDSRINCGKRLARMVCADLEDLGEMAVTSIAQSVRSVLIDGISASLRQATSHSGINSVPCFKVFGSGAFLAKEVIENANLDLFSNATLDLFSSDSLKNQTATALAVATKRQFVFESQATSMHE